jgi:O-antigen/teichoic acid export membrane protein
MNARHSYSEGLSRNVVSFGVLGFLGLISAIAIARLYGVTVLGEFALVSAPVNVLFAFSSAREQVGLVRELATLPPRAPRVTGLFYAVLVFSFGLTVVVGLLTVGATYLLFNGPIHHPGLVKPAVVAIIGYTIFINTCWNMDMVFSAFHAGGELFATRLNQAVAFIVLSIAATYEFKTIWGLVAATILSYVTSLIHKAFALRKYMRATVPLDELRRGLQTLPELIRFGLKIAPGQIFDGVTSECGTFVMGVLSPVAALGAYNRAQQLGKRFLDLQAKVLEMLFPALVRRRSEADHHGFDRALMDSIRYSVAGMLLPAAALGGAAVGVMKVFGSGFSSGSGALTVIMLVPALVTVSSLQRAALIAVGRPWTTAISGSIRMIVSVAATIFLVMRLEATGAALGIVVGVCFDMVYTSANTRRHLQIPATHLWTVRQMLATGLAYGAGFATARGIYSSFESWGGLLLALVASVLVYVGVFVLSGGLAARDRDRIAMILGVLRRRTGVLVSNR